MNYIQLIQSAEQKRSTSLTEVLKSNPVIRDAFESGAVAKNPLLAFSSWARALNEANQHITVHKDDIDGAASAYTEIARHLEARLNWPRDSISISPQGSASTQTLIKSPFGGEKFDIDAICAVDISQVSAKDPMGFFQSVGDALEDFRAEAKKRCWHIPFASRPFYLEFTPSVPLDNVPQSTIDMMGPRYQIAQSYRSTALAVVDTPTQQWKTSNPAGMTHWVNDTARMVLISQAIPETRAFVDAAAKVEPVPGQEVEITDTLRIAIRLFKRHRDMCARRGLFKAEYKPISIIIVTLLTSLYQGLAALGRRYSHPVELLLELATLMRDIDLDFHGEYRVDNPTVEEENFAEKWNTDNGVRARAYRAWCVALTADLDAILQQTHDQAILQRVREVFGIPSPTSDGTAKSFSRYPAPPPTPAGRGLA